MNNSDWLDIDVLEDYLDGKLDAKTMHRVERLSLEDPFVAEALAGLSQSPKRVQSLSLLQKQLQDRIALKPVEQRRWQITSQRLSIAAAAAVLFVTVSLLFWMREKGNRDQLAANTAKKVEVAIAPAQTIEKPNAEIEKVIAEAKANTYASNSKGRRKEQRARNKEQGTKSKEQGAESKEQEVTSPLALAEKVAGLSIQNDKSPPENTSLNEVVIVGYGAKKLNQAASSASRILLQPEPVGGWDKFEAYVIDNNKLLKDKKMTGRFVTISFDLDKDGKPINIKALKRFETVPVQTEAEETEAIRLIKDGPRWGPKSSKETTVNIKF